MKSIPPIVLLLLAVLFASCSSDHPLASDSPTDPGTRTDKSRGRPGMPMGQYLHANKEALGRQTFQGAYMLERAVWRFAAENGGVFPSAVYDDNEAGKRLTDYLPGGNQLWNPFVGVRSNPLDGFADMAGDIAYISVLDDLGYIVGYSISARGVSYPLQYMELQYYPPRSDTD